MDRDLPDVDVLVVGAGITGIYQLHRALEAGFSAPLRRGRRRRRRHLVLEPLPRAPASTPRATPTATSSPRSCSTSGSGRSTSPASPRPSATSTTSSTGSTSGATCASAPAVTVGGLGRRRRARGRSRPTTATTIRARFLVAATGVLSVPYLPDVPGRDDFRGVQHHTGRWPAEPVDFAGKRVAVVGTSSSGVQVVAADRRRGRRRSPCTSARANWCTPLNNRPITAEEQARAAGRLRGAARGAQHLDPRVPPPAERPKSAFDDPPEERQAFFEQMWASPGFMKFTSNYVDILINPAANAEWCEFIAGKIRGIVDDPDTAERLIPKDHRYGEKRPPFVTGYFEAFNRPERVARRPARRRRSCGSPRPASRPPTACASSTSSCGPPASTSAPAPCTAWASAAATASRSTDHWADGPTTFLGVQTAGFPNLFFPGGPHAAAGNNPRYNGDQVDFVTDMLVHAPRRTAATSSRSTPEAEERWTAHDRQGARPQTPFGTIGQYVGGNIPGKPRRYLLNAGGRPEALQGDRPRSSTSDRRAADGRRSDGRDRGERRADDARAGAAGER